MDISHQLEEINQISINLENSKNYQDFYDIKYKLLKTLNEINSNVKNILIKKHREFSTELEDRKNILLSDIQKMINMYHDETLEPDNEFKIFETFLVTYRLTGNSHEYTFRQQLIVRGLDKLCFPLRDNDISYALMNRENVTILYDECIKYLDFCKDTLFN
jgi:hypothetical protein